MLPTVLFVLVGLRLRGRGLGQRSVPHTKLVELRIFRGFPGP